MSSTGFALRVVLPQAAAGARPILRGAPGRLGGVDVVVDRPTLELGDRQHERHPPTTGAGGTCCATTILAPLCKCAVQKNIREVGRKFC